jgi:hypothetical protein
MMLSQFRDLSTALGIDLHLADASAAMKKPTRQAMLSRRLRR